MKFINNINNKKLLAKLLLVTLLINNNIFIINSIHISSHVKLKNTITKSSTNNNNTNKSTTFTKRDLGLVFEAGSKIFPMVENGLNTISAKQPIKGDFTVKLKINKLQKEGYISIGVSQNVEDKKFFKNEWLGIDKPGQWGLSNNKLIGEQMGKWNQNDDASFKEGDYITIFRNKGLIGFRVNGLPNEYSFSRLANKDVYLSISLKNNGDEVQIVSDTNEPTSLGNAPGGSFNNSHMRRNKKCGQGHGGVEIPMSQGSNSNGDNKKPSNGGGSGNNNTNGNNGNSNDINGELSKAGIGADEDESNVKPSGDASDNNGATPSVQDQTALNEKIGYGEANELVAAAANATFKNRVTEEARKELLGKLLGTADQPSDDNTKLKPGKEMDPNKGIASPNGKYTFKIKDGDLQLKENDNIIWNSGTEGKARGGGKMELLDDGTLVLKSVDSNEPYWASESKPGTENSKLEVTDNREARIVDKNKNVLWSTESSIVPGSEDSNPNDSLKMNTILNVGENLISKNKKFKLDFNERGTLQITNTSGKQEWSNKAINAQMLVMQNDGDLVAYNKQHKKIWSSMEGLRESDRAKLNPMAPPFKLVLSDEGILEVKAAKEKIIFKSAGALP